MGSQLLRKGERKGPTYNGRKWRGGGLPLRGQKGGKGELRRRKEKGITFPKVRVSGINTE